MNNYIQPGDTLELTAPVGGVVSGMGYLIGRFFAVATIDADAGDQFQGKITGVVDLPKTTGTAWTEGQLIYWDAAEQKAKTLDEAGANQLIGAAARLGGELSAAATGRVRLNGFATPLLWQDAT